MGMLPASDFTYRNLGLTDPFAIQISNTLLRFARNAPTTGIIP
jgi:hypothetical protein